MTSLQSLSKNVAALSEDVVTLTMEFKGIKAEFKTIKWIVPVIVTLGIAIIGVIVAIK
jgi:hypothetical protein